MFSSASALIQNVLPKAAPPGTAHEAVPVTSGQAPGGAMGGLISFLPLLVLVPFLLLMFRRQKKEQELRSKLKRGDRVVSQSGLIGELVEIDARVAKVKIAPGTTVTMTAASVSPFEVEVAKPEASAKAVEAAPESSKGPHPALKEMTTGLDRK